MANSSEQLIRDIEDMKVKGAYLITRVALEAIELRAHEAAAQSDRIAPVLRAAADRLRAAQPSMASVGNACAYVLRGLPDDQAQQATRQIAERGREFLAAFDRAQEQVVEVGARCVRAGEVFFIHSYTGTLLGMFRRAREHGTQFSVIATESRPYCEGRVMVTELLKLGIPCTIITDASIGSYIQRADKSLVGSDSILSNGGVVNKMGTYLLALACQAARVPLYAAGSIFKLSVASVQGDAVAMLRRPDDGAIAPKDPPPNAPLQVENTIFDLTPAQLIEALITDQGVLPPAAIAGFRDHPMLRAAT